jgi:predicted TIM-barrel fold metal-dependent hydrolase
VYQSDLTATTGRIRRFAGGLWPGGSAMMIDCHTHIFPADIRVARQDYCAAETEFGLLYRSPKSKMVGAKELVATMDREGVDKAVVFGFPWKSADTFRHHNDYIIAAVEQFPERLIGFGCFDPCHPQAANEALRCIGRGLCGIGELAFYQCGIDAAALDHLAPVMRLCRDRHLPVLIHTNEPVGHRYPGKSPNTLLQIYELIRRFPENVIILGHWGGGIFFYNLLKKEVADSLENVYYDTAASPYLYDIRIYAFAAQLTGVDKILFGSDYPLLPPSRYLQEFAAAGLSQSDIEQIKGGNAARLLGL